MFGRMMMSKTKIEYTPEMVEKCSSHMLTEILNSHVDEIEILKKYRDLVEQLEADMQSGNIRLIAPVLSDGEFSEFIVVRTSAVHYSSKLIYILDGRK
jgi:hypothetical protein